MRPIYQSTIGSATSGAVVPLDWRGSSPYATVAVILAGTPTLTYTVEYTLDDVWSQTFDPATATWFPFPVAALVAATANQSGLLDRPVTGIRLRVSAWTQGTARLVIVPANGPSA